MKHYALRFEFGLGAYSCWEMEVVLGAGWPGVMLHEAVGHGLEEDFNRERINF